jgi:hypothetical protein
MMNSGRKSGSIFPRSTLRKAVQAANRLRWRGKGVKILSIVDRHGLPLSESTHAANPHEVTLVQLSFDFYMC